VRTQKVLLLGKYDDVFEKNTPVVKTTEQNGFCTTEIF
jgi:hypothetical protein